MPRRREGLRPQQLENKEATEIGIPTLFPTEEEFVNLPLEALHEMWQNNHAAIMDYYQKHDIPFFGMHGTTPQQFAEMRALRTNKQVQLATRFSKKIDSPLSQRMLYEVPLAAVSYAARRSRTSPGILLALNLEHAASGKHIGTPWETMNGGNLNFKLGVETSEEKELFQDVNILDEAALVTPVTRTLVAMNDNDFKKRLAGWINLRSDSMQKYTRPQRPVDMTQIILKQRFVSQEILARLLPKLSGKIKKSTE